KLGAAEIIPDCLCEKLFVKTSALLAWIVDSRIPDCLHGSRKLANIGLRCCGLCRYSLFLLCSVLAASGTSRMEIAVSGEVRSKKQRRKVTSLRSNGCWLPAQTQTTREACSAVP